ncbi:MAG: hypothetical protein IPL46_14420 [Saprospiraceae bacterium]|nr:hypothetical protein [Saprospiraceae bacterium]
MLHKLHHRQVFEIRGFDVDLTMQASIPAMIRLMHDAAIDQVMALGFSALQLEPRGLGWVLANQHLQLFKQPHLGDQIEVLTFPSGVDKIFTYRDYYLYDCNQNLLAQASTTWILMDINRRKTSPFPEDIQAVLKVAPTAKHLPRAHQLRIQIDRADLEKKIIPGYFELDFNRHVNNQYFFRWMLEPFSIGFLLNHQISEFNVKIKGEVFADEKISSQVQFSDQATTKHILSKEGEIVATGLAIWIKKT